MRPLRPAGCQRGSNGSGLNYSGTATVLRGYGEWRFLSQEAPYMPAPAAHPFVLTPGRIVTIICRIQIMARFDVKRIMD